MLEGYGLHTLIWDSADERLGDFLVASPADATGRGLELHVRQGGAAADLTGAEVYGSRSTLNVARGNGVSEEAKLACSELVVIPMRGRAESLNAAAAGAVLLWEMTGRGR